MQRTELFTNPSLRVLTWNCSIAFETVHVSKRVSSSRVLAGTVNGWGCINSSPDAGAAKARSTAQERQLTFQGQVEAAV